MVWTAGDNKFAYWDLPNHVGMLTTMFIIGIHIVHSLTFRTHLLSTYEVLNMSKRTVIPGVHSLSKNTYKYLTHRLLAVSGAT